MAKFHEKIKKQPVLDKSINPQPIKFLSYYYRPDQGDTVGSFIAKHLESFPSWLKVVCTVRSSMTCVVKCLPFHQINLDKCVLDERIKKDLVDYIQYRIETSPNIQVNITPVHLATAASSKFLQQDSQIGPQERFLQHLIQICAGMYVCPNKFWCTGRVYKILGQKSFFFFPKIRDNCSK